MIFPSILLSAAVTALVTLPQLIFAQNFHDIDGCVQSCNAQSPCGESDTKCVCDSTNNGYLNQLVDCLHSTCDHHGLIISDQLNLLQKDCKNAGVAVNPSNFVAAGVYAHGLGDVIVGAPGSTNTIPVVPDIAKTTISVVVTETMVITDEIKTTDSMGHFSETKSVHTTEVTITSESVSIISTSYESATITHPGGSVSVGGGTVSVGGDGGTVIVGGGSVVISGSTVHTDHGHGKPTSSSSSAGSSATAGSSGDNNSAGAATFLRVWGVGAVVMMFAGVGSLIMVL